MRFLALSDVVKLNRRHLDAARQEYFPPENLCNRGSLEWVLDAIQYPLSESGVDLYPGLVEKAARLAWTIIRSHVFWDGNKRTGMSALLLFLRLNGYDLNVTEEELEDWARAIADPRNHPNLGCENLADWVRHRLIIYEGPKFV